MSHATSRPPLRSAPLLLLALGACSPPPTPGPTPVEEPTNEVRREVVRSETSPSGVVEYYPTPNKARIIDFQGTPDVLWPRVLAAYRTLGLPLGEIDTQAHTVGTSSVRVIATFAHAAVSTSVDCGASALGSRAADTYSVTLRVVTELRPSSITGATTVRTLVSAFAKPNSTEGDPVYCTSTGSLETRLARLVDPSAGTTPHRP